FDPRCVCALEDFGCDLPTQPRGNRWFASWVCPPETFRILPKPLSPIGEQGWLSPVWPLLSNPFTDGRMLRRITLRPAHVTPGRPARMPECAASPHNRRRRRDARKRARTGAGVPAGGGGRGAGVQALRAWRGARLSRGRRGA